MRFVSTIIFILVAYTSSQALAAALPAHGESVDALRPSGHDNTWKSLEARDIEVLERRARIKAVQPRKKGGGGKRRGGGGKSKLGGGKACFMTSKPGSNCNVSTCRAGGGRCTLTPSGRCQGTNMWGSNAPFECSTNCHCSS